ncbi:hypothetical protein FG386_000278 [Cryptosporidium ryanae]|uniref:uncharacterized protein n=1 Tax=Cryptosporidium ryanae TaxID=515981 RepID=UPI003519DC4B|nr:hypothetical protein FG386_000278 [Cryptosporidium ryanae]
MDIDKLTHIDLLRFHHLEKAKLKSLCNEAIVFSNEIKTTCKNVIESGLGIINRFYNIIKSRSRLDFFLNIDGNFLSDVTWQFSEILKSSRFCLEALIWVLEDDEYSTLTADLDKYTLTGLLCKILIFQGDFLEMCIQLEKLIYSDSRNQGECQKIRDSFSYVLEFLKKWEMYQTNSNSIHCFHGINKLRKDNFVKEIRLRILNSFLFGGISYNCIDNFLNVFQELHISNLYVDLPSNVNDDKFNVIKRVNIFRLFFEDKNTIFIRQKKSTNLMVRPAIKFINEEFSKDVVRETSLDKHNILNIMNMFCYNLSIITSIEVTTEQFLDIPSLILSELNKIHNTDEEINYRRKRTKGTCEAMNIEAYPKNYEHENFQVDSLLNIINFINNSVGLPNFNDKQYKTWIQMIPFYCYNLMLSILGKDEMRCDDFFRLNLTSNLPSTEQFDELIMKELSILCLTNNQEFTISPCDLFFDSKDIFNNLRSLTLELFYIVKHSENVTLIIDEILLKVNNYLLNLNLLLNKFTLDDKVNNKEAIAKIIDALFTHLKCLHIYCTCLIEYVVYYKVDNCVISRNRQSDLKHNIFSKFNNNSFSKWGHLAYNVLNSSAKNDLRILSLFHSLLKTLVSFNIILSNTLNYSFDNNIKTFFLSIERDIELILDIFTIYKTSCDSKYSEDNFPIHILYVLFILSKIKNIKFYYKKRLHITFEGSMLDLREYLDIINILMDYLDTHEHIRDVDNGKNCSISSISHIVFSNYNLTFIFERLVIWNLVLSKNNCKFVLSDSIKHCLRFIELSILEYQLNSKMNSSNSMNSEVTYNLFLHNINSFLETYLIVEQNFSDDILPIFHLNGGIKFIIITIIEILRKDSRSILSNSTLLVYAICNLSHFFSIVIKNEHNIKDSIPIKIKNELLNIMVLIVSKIHTLFIFHLTNHRTNILLIRCLMVLLLTIFNFYQLITSFVINPGIVINLFRYLIYLEFALGLQKDDKDNLKYSNLSDHMLTLKHTLSNYCSFYQLLDHSKAISTSKYSICKQSLSKSINFILRMTNVRNHLFFSFIKYGLIYDFSYSISDWFCEISSFVDKYNTNILKGGINDLFIECDKIKKKFYRYFNDYKFINNEFNKKYDNALILPEQETEYLELFGVLLQLIYGIPVCPLPSEPFNKLPVYNQSLVLSCIKNECFFVNDDSNNTTSLSYNINSLINYSIYKEMAVEKENNVTFGFLTPGSPILSLCCNIFDFLINCTSLTEKQYSDSKVSFYSSFIGLIEELFFYSKFGIEDSSPIESEYFWNIISSPVIFPAFMECLYTEIKSKTEPLTHAKVFNSIYRTDLSFSLFNSCISDTILNFYDNIYALPTNFEYIKIREFNDSILQLGLNYNSYNIDPLIFVDTNSRELFSLSFETILFCKYYLALFLDEFMKNSLDSNFLLDKKLHSKSLNALKNKAVNCIGDKNYLHKVIIGIFNNEKKKYYPLNFLKNCFISCIPDMYIYRNSNLWYPGKFGNSHCSSIFHGGISANNTQNLRKLYIYLKWINMNLFFVDSFDVKLITACINILKLIISEYDDCDSLELTYFSAHYSHVLKRIISQVVLLLEIEYNYYSNLFEIKDNDVKYSVKEIDLLLAISFDNLCIRMINIKEVYSNINIKYVLLEEYILCETKLRENSESNCYNDQLLVNCISTISKVREKMFTLFFPFLTSVNIKWCNVNSNYFEKINNAIWLPSYLESKCRFKLAKVQIYSYLYNEKDHKKLDLAIRNIIIAYSLSTESLLLCYLSLNGTSTEIFSFLECIKLFIRENSYKPLIHFFKEKEILIYKVINEIFLNKFPSKHPFYDKINSNLNVTFLKFSTSNLNNSIINHLHYFYRSFYNIQSIKQFALLLINSKQIQLTKYLIDSLLETLFLKSVSAKYVDKVAVDWLINELIFDELDASQSIIKKNKLVQTSLSPYIIQLQSYFSIINFVMLKRNSLELLSFYQKIFLSNKKVLPFYVVDNSKLLNDHYNGLYLRRNRKHINSKFRFIRTLEFILLVSKSEIYSNISSIKSQLINSDILLYAKNKYLPLNNLDRCYIGIYLCIYSSQLKNNIDMSVHKRLIEITYCYMESINLIFEQLLDIIFNEIKTVRQLPTIDMFECEISDEIKLMNKKGSELKTYNIKTINWNDVCEYGKFNISLKIVNGCFSKILELLNFVISLNLPIDGRFFSNTFGLVFLFCKNEICIVQGKNNTDPEYIVKNIQNISQTVLKQLERHFGSIITNSIPFSLIKNIFNLKQSIEDAFITLFNQNFLMTININIESTKVEIAILINLILEFVGMNPIFNAINSIQSNRNKTNYDNNINKTAKFNPSKKRKTEYLNLLFSENEAF